MHTKARLTCAALLAALFGAFVFGAPQGHAQDEVSAPSEAEIDKAMEKIPPQYRPVYDHYWVYAKLFDNPYANWTPPPPPWQVCYNDSYLGSSWRSDVLHEIEALAAYHAEAGLTKKDVISTDSNNDIGLQLSQFNNLLRQGCNIIITIPGTPSGLCSGFADAVQRGVLVVTVDSAASCKEVINVGSNEYADAKRRAGWVIKEMGGKGNIMFVLGAPGISTTVAALAGMNAAVAENPGVQIADTIYGFWAPAPAKTNLVQWLATHPTQIDGMVSAGGMAVALDEGLLQSGRELVPHATTSECSYIAYWHQNGLHSYGLHDGGTSNGYEGFYVAMRMMLGQKPVTNTLWFELPEITDADAARLDTGGITPRSTTWCDEADHRLAPIADYFDAYFEGGEPVTPMPHPHPKG